MLIETPETIATAPTNLFTLAADAPPNGNVKLSLARNELRTELDLLSEIVDAKQPLFPQLLLEARQTRVRLRAMGRYNTLQCEVAAQVKQTGSVCLPAKKFADVARHLPAATLDLASQTEAATLKCGDSRFTFKTQDAATFPALAEATETIATVPSDALLKLLRTAMIATAKSAATGRYLLEGVQLTFSPTGLRVIATDGHRLLCAERADLMRAEAVTLFISRHSLPTLLKLLSLYSGAVILSRNTNYLQFQFPTRRLDCLLLDGDFPACEPILGQEFQHELTLEGDMFRAAIQRMAVLGADGAGADFGIIKFHFAPDGNSGSYEIQSVAPNGSEGQEEILPLTTDMHDAITISFNGRYLLDFVRTINPPTITIKYNDANSSVALAPVANDVCAIRYIVMPCLP